ncbi:MAG TPA: helix-turn-helix domain-containing protein [Pseudonocardiaceae bacterium]
MGRLTRAQAQERNRARVLAAARSEFAERGYRDARVDDIAARAELTRGAVYSNFPGKRALYFAVLAEEALAEPVGEAEPGATVPEALAALARAWVTRLPLVSDERHGAARLGTALLAEVSADEAVRAAYAQLLKLQAVTLGLALEALESPGPPDPPERPERPDRPHRGGPRRVRLAEAALTLLHGAGQLASAAPGFVEPFDVIGACAGLATLDLGDHRLPPQAAATARAVDEPWAPPPAPDLLADRPCDWPEHGVVAVLGVRHLAAVEQALRTGHQVTAVVVMSEPAELAPLVRLAVADLRNHLRRAFPPHTWPPLRVLCDEHGAVARAVGVTDPGDATQAAALMTGNRIVARASGYGACHVVAAQDAIRPRRTARRP